MAALTVVIVFGFFCLGWILVDIGSTIEQSTKTLVETLTEEFGREAGALSFRQAIIEELQALQEGHDKSELREIANRLAYSSDLLNKLDEIERAIDRQTRVLNPN